MSIRCSSCERRVTLLACPSRTMWMASQDRESDRASTQGRVTRSEPRRLFGAVPMPNTKAIYCVAGRRREWRLRSVECREEGRDMNLLGVDDGNGSGPVAFPLPLLGLRLGGSHHPEPGEEDGDWSGSSVLQSLGSSPTRTPSLAWWFSPPAPNHKPQDRFGPWDLWLGEEDSNPH